MQKPESSIHPSKVQVHDLTFDLLIHEREIHQRVAELGQLLNEAYVGERPLFVVVLNGSFLFAADLVRHLEMNPEVQFVALASYGNLLESSGEVKIQYGHHLDVKDRHVILVEDIVDSGKTMDMYREQLRLENPASLRLVSLLFKPDSYLGQEPPDWIGFEIPPAFVVGYGMDYAQHGRELRSIYHLVEASES
ncbi:hypoxanthine phosphoribosyltransferase [Pontibacter sp. G13]|uniref:hypoxanthine phosphoribosyltransferase n=1 Tax=Pontibacter sp. G13 TaxID=3074898 RepID=UPI00288A3A8D|nr:hypoxanthine phosphoribosyltransferase [Pontibacter sp. G13]WNJ16688.1 hypoxanthine phosphoribosyltransferase [Pontibacter sp. G13]